MTDGADLMDWGPTSGLPGATSVYLPVAEYSTVGSSPLVVEPLAIQADDSLRFNPFTEPDTSWANWSEIEYAMNSITHDNTFVNSGYRRPSSELSVGSTYLSIGSIGSSNHSCLSWRGRSRIQNVFSRSSSIAGRAKSTMQEGMSSWSLSGAKKHVSPSPRRTGKLTDAVRAGMRLLKGQGACWKCKILKKSVRKMALYVSYQADKFNVTHAILVRNVLPPPR
jgi:hypothetical protein